MKNMESNNKKIKVIIFDLDGLLIDSQPLQYQSYNSVFSSYGYPITKKDWEQEWVHNSISCKDWVQKNNIPLNYVDLRTEKQKIYKKLIVSDLKLKKGANYAISLLMKHYKLCIASASQKTLIDVVADKFNFNSRFNNIVSDQESQIKRGKPFPDVFLYVAKQMQVLPEECLVIEDSVAGLKAAKSANMKCIICPDDFCEFELSNFSNANRIINNLGEISLELIENLD